MNTTNVPSSYLPPDQRQPRPPASFAPNVLQHGNTLGFLATPVCRYRECSNTLPVKPAGKRGPAPEFCSTDCRRRERHEREKDQGMHQPKPRVSRPRPESRKYHPGQTFGDLTLVEYVERSRAGETRCLFRCSCGNSKVLQLSAVVSGRTTNCAARAAHADPRSKGTEITYSTAHGRVRAARGPAKDHRCAFCSEQAYDWAYGHGCTDERADDHGKEAGRPFSPNPDMYVPACRAHHASHTEQGQVIKAAVVTPGFTLLWATRPTEQAAA